MSRFPFCARLRQWLYDLLRRARAEASPALMAPSIDGGPDRSMLDQPSDAAAYRMAAATLPSDRRAIFELHQIGGLSFAEIAERTGASVAHVEHEIAAALTHLVTRLQENADRPA